MLEGYITHFSQFDWVIAVFGACLAAAHVIFIVGLCFRAVWATQHGDYWQSVLAGLCELLPLLGLLGTVLGILNTFEAVQGLESGSGAMKDILGTFAPALTTTVTGVVGLVVNLVLNATFNISRMCIGGK